MSQTRATGVYAIRHDARGLLRRVRKARKYYPAALARRMRESREVVWVKVHAGDCTWREAHEWAREPKGKRGRARVRLSRTVGT